MYYNRFRHYSVDSGTYISQDPLGLEGAMPNFYSYVDDINVILDPLGLTRRRKNGQFAKKPGPKLKPSSHGNTASSTKPAILYAMYDEDGEFQKWGITQETDPYKRYGNTLPEGNTLEIMDKGNRNIMLALEREKEIQILVVELKKYLQIVTNNYYGNIINSTNWWS